MGLSATFKPIERSALLKIVADTQAQADSIFRDYASSQVSAAAAGNRAELGRDTPAAYTGRHFSFSDVYLEPKPFRPEGPPSACGQASVLQHCCWNERPAPTDRA